MNQSVDVLQHKIAQLPQKAKDELDMFVDFLLVKYQQKEGEREFGSARGLIELSEDFDDPLEDFAEYQ